jgi:hypothetical protein
MNEALLGAADGLGVVLLLEGGLRHEGAVWIGADSRAAAGRRPAVRAGDQRGLRAPRRGRGRAATQAALAGIALELVAITDRLQRIHDELPASPNREAMWAHELPYDVATEIYGTIECVLADHLRTVIEYIEGASRVTAEELRERFERGGQQ